MAREPGLILYGTCWCADCAQARRFLKARGVKWRDVDVDEDPAAERRVLGFQRGARLVPVFEYEGRHVTVSPFDRGKLSRWLLEVGAATAAQVSDAAPSGPGT